MYKLGYSFLPPKSFKSTSQFAWCTKHLNGSFGAVVMKNILSLNNIEKTKTTETEFFAKCCEKCKNVKGYILPSPKL